MSKRMLSYIAVIGLAFCLWPSMTWAADACSPTNITSRSSTTVLIPRVGAPQTPDSGVADGWVLVYKDSEYKQLSHEVFCQDNQIQFAASAGDKDFQENPDCTVANCTKAVGTEKVAVTGVAGDTNELQWAPALSNPYGLTGFTALYTFQGGNGGPDGENPEGPLIMDASGSLYGTTSGGGGSGCGGGGCGTAFEISPASGGGAKETTLYDFSLPNAYPDAGFLMDASGNLYSTTAGGNVGSSDVFGTVFELSPGNPWTENTLYTFAGGAYGADPYSGLVSDASGNLYGITIGGGVCTISNRDYAGGAVFKLSPGNPWTETLLYTFFQSAYPYDYGSLAIDGSGNLYGTTVEGGAVRGQRVQNNPNLCRRKLWRQRPNHALQF